MLLTKCLEEVTQTDHITLAPERLMGWKLSVGLASSDLQKKNRGFMSRKEALKI